MRLLAAEPRSITGLLFPCQYLYLNDLSDPVFDGVGLASFKSRAQVEHNLEAAEGASRAQVEHNCALPG